MMIRADFELIGRSFYRLLSVIALRVQDKYWGSLCWNGAYAELRQYVIYVYRPRPPPRDVTGKANTDYSATVVIQLGY